MTEIHVDIVTLNDKLCDTFIDMINNNIISEENKKHLCKAIHQTLLDNYKSNLKKYNTIQDKEVDISYIKIGKIFELLHGCYSDYNIDNVKNVCYLFHKNKYSTKSKEITITTTTCKRIDLFKRTVNSFIECCTDLELVKEWITIDDNSSEKDINEMKELYPFITFIEKKENQRGHVNSMNMLKKMISTKYIFNLEDDWEFIYKDNYLTRCLEIIKLKPQYGQCLINKNYGEGERCFETVGGILKSYIKEDFVQQFYFEHQYIPENRAMQMELEKYAFIRPKTQYGSQYYWPHFSLRVGLTKMSVLDELGDFESVPHFEMNYANKYNNKNYITTFLESVYCSHIGRRTYERFDKSKPNAYELNKVNQFGGVQNICNNKIENNINNKENELLENAVTTNNTENAVTTNNTENAETIISKDINLNDIFKTFVVNLKRRPDRLNDFYNKNKHLLTFLDIEVEEAVDGEQLDLNQKMRKIFHTSDTMFRRGIMGCAFSHMKLWGKLANDKTHSMYLVLEDDVEMANSSEMFLKYITTNLFNKIQDWDILFLGYHLKKHNKDNSIVIQKLNPDQFMEHSYGGTFSYLINKRGAVKLLSNLMSNGMNYAIDWDMCRLECMNNYYIYPLLGYSEMANNQPSNDSDIQKSHNRINSSVHDWILDDINKMMELTDNKGILYFEKDNWNKFIYDKYKFDVNSNIIVSSSLVNKNLLFTNICFTQIWYDNTKQIQDLLTMILEENIPLYFYTIYERYLVTVPESFYNRFNEMKQHFTFINKLDFDYVI